MVLVEGTISDDAMHFRMQSRADGEKIGRRDRGERVVHVPGRRAILLEPLYDRREPSVQIVKAESVDGHQQHQWVLRYGTGRTEQQRDTDKERGGDHFFLEYARAKNEALLKEYLIFFCAYLNILLPCSWFFL